MNKFIGISLMLLMGTGAFAQNNDCVYPKTKTLSSGSLVFRHPVTVYKASAPTAANSIGTLKELNSYWVTQEAHGMMLLADKDSNQPIGWVKKSDMRYLALRNCNL